MRLSRFLLAVLTIFAASCREVASTDGIVASEHTAGVSKRYLKGVKMDDKVEKRRLAGISTLLGKLKELSPDLSKVSTLVVKGPKTKAAVSILKKQLKALAVIGAIAVTGGFIVYLVKK
jgi:hypothetical protein